jgi:hypothetical protein
MSHSGSVWFTVGLVLGVVVYAVLGLVTSRWMAGTNTRVPVGGAGLRAGVGLSDTAPSHAHVRRRVTINGGAGSTGVEP